MSIQIGNEANIKDIADEFRVILEKINIFMNKEPEYIIDIQTFEKELLEEKSLQAILDDNNPENFKGIRDLLFSFQQKNDIVSKLNKLQELYKELQDIIISNNQKLSKHTEVSELVASINDHPNINAAENIPIIINDIRNFLINKGRLHDNHPANVYSTLLTSDNKGVISGKQHNEKQGHFSALYLDGNTWFYLGDLENKNIFPSGDNTRTLCFWAKQDVDDAIRDEAGIFGWGSIEPEP